MATCLNSKYRFKFEIKILFGRNNDFGNEFINIFGEFFVCTLFSYNEF